MDNHHKQPKNISNLCTCINMRRASRAITKIYDKALEPSGLKAAQLSLLANIKAHGPVSVSGLAKITSLDRTTLVRNLKPLETGGLIERCLSQDSREKPLQLTEEGVQAIRLALPLWKSVQSSLSEQLGEDQINLVRQLADSLENMVDGA